MPHTNSCPRCGETYDDDVAFCAKDGTRLVRAGQSTDLVGTVIADRYRIESRIGEGGMGQVFLAEHVRMKRKSAIKIMRPALVGDIEALRRFTREAENASQLSHPNIAAIFDFGETTDGLVYLAMEYVDGESLAAKLDRDAALHPDIAADILGQSADALQAAHDLNMLHRDIKPDNIMLGLRPDGTYMVKLVDFGIARTMDTTDTRVTRTGYSIGTPQYMSPEQLAGDALDARSDQYSLALVAFYALTGKQAFPSESSKESLVARLTSRPRTLQDARHEIEWPETLQEIFNRALAPEAVDRFDTISEFAHALAGAIGSMTPSQTAELYRRALDTRVANVAARTPHSDLEGWRSASGAMSALRTSGPTENVRRSASVNSPANAILASAQGPPLTGQVTTTGGSVVTTQGARWPVIGIVIAAIAGAAWFIAGRTNASNSNAASLNAAIADSAASVAVLASGKPTGAMTAGVAGAAGSAAAGLQTGASATKGSIAPNNPATAAADSAKRAHRDSVRRAAQLAKAATADSLARANSVRARFPEAAARATIARGVDAKARMVRNNDVRTVIMPTPVFLWRAEDGRAWKQGHPTAAGTMPEIVDPIEAWSAWPSLVSSRRAVYVIEVSPDRTPWPSYAPDKIFEIKKGDVESVELLRDGSPVPLESTARISALVNTAAHQSAGKPTPNAFVAMIGPTTFMPREDGSLPKIEVLVHDASRGGAITRFALSESLVRRLYDDFAPWRDAIARP